MAADAVEIRLGDQFQSFDELSAYKQANFVEFWKRDCRTIAAARKRGIERPLKAALRYHDIPNWQNTKSLVVK